VMVSMKEKDYDIVSIELDKLPKELSKKITRMIDRVNQLSSKKNLLLDHIVVIMAAHASRWSIGTHKLKKSLYMLNECGARVTAEQYSNISAKAVKFANSTGHDVTYVFDNMIRTIIKENS
jgi:hypothetical protein